MKLKLIGLFGLLAFCYLLAIFFQLQAVGSLERFNLHVDAPFWLFLQCLFAMLLLWLLRTKFRLLDVSSVSISRDFFILVAVIPFIALLNTILGLVIFEELIFGKSHTLYQWVTTYLFEIILNSVAGLGSISYFYISTLNEIRERLSSAQLAQSEMQLKILQQKVDPHFLFNNLNVLSSLIEKDPNTANEFLDRLAKLYRYILHTQDMEVVPFNDELTFAKDYLYLLEMRFGSAYKFDLQIPDSSVVDLMIVPTALQSLFENVVKHNAGSQTKPLQITTKIDGEKIVVKNQIRPKLKPSAASGTGLENLRARYALLTEDKFEVVVKDGSFSAAIPLIRIKK